MSDTIETVEIGGAPYEADCAQIGEKFPDGPRLNRLECSAYIEALRRVHGQEPAGSELRTKSNAHEFGTYREVVYRYDHTNEAHRAYAVKAERGLAKWADARMTAPVQYDPRGQKYPPLWIADSARACFWPETTLRCDAELLEDARRLLDKIHTWDGPDEDDRARLVSEISRRLDA